MKAILLLGRHGDLVNFLPIAKDIYDRSGEKPVWIVNKLYQSTLMGVSYITIDAVHFSLHKVEHAVHYAQEKYGAENVINGMAWGKQWKGRRDASFNFLSWENAGYGNSFSDTKNFPLVFDRRDAEREKFLIEQYVKSSRQLILTCLGCSKSSPFHHAGSVQDSINRKWGGPCETLDLCFVKAARIYDLIALMEKAAVLVTTDTAVLHLSTAVRSMPVIALLNDNQFLSSQPRCNVAFSTPYANAVLSMTKIHETIFAALQARRRKWNGGTSPESNEFHPALEST